MGAWKAEPPWCMKNKMVECVSVRVCGGGGKSFVMV